MSEPSRSPPPAGTSGEGLGSKVAFILDDPSFFVRLDRETPMSSFALQQLAGWWCDPQEQSIERKKRHEEDKEEENPGV